MPPNFCPNCGTRVDDRNSVECASCGHDFELEDDDDFFEDDELLSDTLDNDDPTPQEMGAVTSSHSASPSTSATTIPSGSQSDTSSAFWNTIGGKVIRWIVYLPISMILLGLIEFLAAIFLVWLFAGDMRLFVIVGILFGGIFLAWPLVLAYYGVIVLANKMVCPVPRVGVIIFATIYFLCSIRSVISIYTSDFLVATIVTLTLLRVVFLVTALFSVMSIYSEEH